jgi:succinoglycan biosynthesis transport protein ExoP
MTSTETTQQFGQLRARIEAGFAQPAVIVVSSAQRGDGKTVTAFGLAESLAAADHAVLLVDTNSDAPVLPRHHRVPNLGNRAEFSIVSRYASPVAGQRFSGISLVDDHAASGLSMDKLKALTADMRAHFSYIVVDTAPLPRSEAAVLFATIADGTLLTLRLGRFPSSTDEQTMKTLSRVGATTLGLLTVTPAMIRDFARTREAGIQTVRVPVKPVTSRHTFEPKRDVSEAPRPKSNAIS